MIGLDTNVLVRLLTGDDAKQRAPATLFINQKCSANDPAFINRLVLIETVWVLEFVYHYSREQIAAAADALLRMVRVLTEDADLVRVAVAAYRRGADFANALIAGVNAANGCSRTRAGGFSLRPLSWKRRRSRPFARVPSAST